MFSGIKITNLIGWLCYRKLIMSGVLCATFLAPSSLLGAVFECEVKSAAVLETNGELGTSADSFSYGPVPKPRSFSFDDISGEVTGIQQVKALSVLQERTDTNSLIAFGVMAGLITTTVRMLRIHTRDPQLPFLLVINSEIYTGNCER
jgi:hypothetical protein